MGKDARRTVYLLACVNAYKLINISSHVYIWVFEPFLGRNMHRNACTFILSRLCVTYLLANKEKDLTSVFFSCT